MKKLILISALALSSFTISAQKMSELSLDVSETVTIKGDYVEDQNIETFRDSIGAALEKKYGYSLISDNSLSGGCKAQFERKANGNNVSHGKLGDEGIFYSVNMTSHDPIKIYPPAYVAERFVKRMEDKEEKYYDSLNLIIPTKYWAEIYELDGKYYLVITIS